MALTWLRANISEEPAQKKKQHIVKRGGARIKRAGRQVKIYGEFGSANYVGFGYIRGPLLARSWNCTSIVTWARKLPKHQSWRFYGFFGSWENWEKKTSYVVLRFLCIYVTLPNQSDPRSVFQTGRAGNSSSPQRANLKHASFKLHPAGCLLSSIWALNTMSVTPATPLQYWGSLAARVLRWRERNVNIPLHFFFILVCWIGKSWKCF